MDTISRNVMHHGLETAQPERVMLRAGPLELAFVNGDIRWVRIGGAEAVRRVYMAARDQNWGTAINEITNLKIVKGADAFRITYDALSHLNNMCFEWHAVLTGTADGTVDFCMDGVALHTFMSNRLGLCVLHPMTECAGTVCTVEHSDGSREQGVFPNLIAPHQPFHDIQAIAYEVMPAVGVNIRFTGDVFEMEDQRNWTDASFKTYCTPLSKPYPREILEGSRIRQTVTIKVTGDPRLCANAAKSMESRGLVTHIDSKPESISRLPHLGLGYSAKSEQYSGEEVKRLRALGLNHLRIDLDLSRSEYPAILAAATEAANAIGAGLEVALFVSDDVQHELEDLVQDLRMQTIAPVYAWLIFQRDGKPVSRRWVDTARHALMSIAPGALIGAGTNANFTELNRDRPDWEALDCVAYSINPQVHAFDDASLVETLAAQAQTVHSARAFAGDLPIRVGPVTLRPRLKLAMRVHQLQVEKGEAPSDADLRQISLLGAGWTLGSIKYLAESGTASITFYEALGMNGVMQADDTVTSAAICRLPNGCVFPLYHVLTAVGEYAAGQVIGCSSSQPLVADAMYLRHGDQERIIVANLTAQEQQVTVSAPRDNARVRLLDETTYLDAVMNPARYWAGFTDVISAQDGRFALSLLPYGVAFVDFQ